MRGTRLTFTMENDAGEEEEFSLPAKYEVCGTCHGHGSHVNPNVDGHGITQEERDRDWSPEMWDDYLSGGYDVTCEECKGMRVVLVVDDSQLTPEEQTVYDRYQKHQAELARYRAEEAHEREMGY